MHQQQHHPEYYGNNPQKFRSANQTVPTPTAEPETSYNHQVQASSVQQAFMINGTSAIPVASVTPMPCNGAPTASHTPPVATATAVTQPGRPLVNPQHNGYSHLNNQNHAPQPQYPLPVSPVASSSLAPHTTTPFLPRPPPPTASPDHNGHLPQFPGNVQQQAPPLQPPGNYQNANSYAQPQQRVPMPPVPSTVSQNHTSGPRQAAPPMYPSQQHQQTHTQQRQVQAAPPMYPQQQQQQQPQAPYGLANNFGRMQLQDTGVVNLLEMRRVLPEVPEPAPAVELPELFAHHNVRLDPSIFRCTLNAIPQTAELLQKSRMPLGLMLHPFKDMRQLTVLNSAQIVRCRSCRTYINPYVQFPDQRRWKCNVCFRVNELPDDFFYDPSTKTYGDPQRRPEIKNATVEFMATREYMLRTPQPACYLFMFDVSGSAVESGYLHIVCAKISELIDRLPGDERALIGLIAFSSSIHFFRFDTTTELPHHLIVSDVDDVFVPHDGGLLVNLEEHKEAMKKLLDALPRLFSDRNETRSALGAALNAGFLMTEQIGGRLTVFQTQLPNHGPGSLESREDPNLRAGKDIQSVRPATDFYKQFALKCSSPQIAVDLFLLPTRYADVATLSEVSKFCGGCFHYYPNFNSLRNAVELNRLEDELDRYLTRKIGFEAVLRIRCTRGLSLHTFYGNAFVRSTDLLALSNVNPDAGFGVRLEMEEALTESRTVIMQSALLYTTSRGERRIRVHTLCLPVTTSLQDVFSNADSEAIVALLSRMAADRCVNDSLQSARQAIGLACTDVLTAFGCTRPAGQAPGSLVAPRSLKLLPLYTLGLLKHPGFAYGVSTRLDDRVHDISSFKTNSLSYAMLSIHPNLYALHTILDTAGDDESKIPPRLPLSYECIDRHGVYLLDLGYYLYLYIGQAASDDTCQQLFAGASFGQIDDDMLELPVVESSALNKRVRAFINLLQSSRPFRPALLIIREGSLRAHQFTRRLLEDKSESSFSYVEFLRHLQKEVNQALK